MIRSTAFLEGSSALSGEGGKMTPAQLESAGCLLWGPGWAVSQMVEALGVSDRTIFRWLAGTRDIPPGVKSDLIGLATKAGKAELVAMLRAI